MNCSAAMIKMLLLCVAPWVHKLDKIGDTEIYAHIKHMQIQHISKSILAWNTMCRYLLSGVDLSHHLDPDPVEENTIHHITTEDTCVYKQVSCLGRSTLTSNNNILTILCLSSRLKSSSVQCSTPYWLEQDPLSGRQQTVAVLQAADHQDSRSQISR